MTVKVGKTVLQKKIEPKFFNVNYLFITLPPFHEVKIQIMR
jgi:hypothetical protein